ncbi:MAG: septation protein IspZ [Pseudomonadota bacterium]
MDKRLLVEIVPGPAFLLGNALGGIFLGALLATLATAAAIALRWRWDQRLPLMALAIFGLTAVMLALGHVYRSETFIKMSNTVGSLLFAAIIALGARLEPSLLERTLGHSLSLKPSGWHRLHGAWIAVSIARAALNEAVWRGRPTDTWAVYNGVSDIGWILIFIGVTALVAHGHWQDDPKRP